MQNIKETIGVDVSKLTIEVRIHTSQASQEFKNTLAGHKKLIKWVSKATGFEKGNLLYAFEHTGLYSFPLSSFLSENGFNYIMIPGLELKRSMGIARGKDDRIDAKRIAEYAFMKKEKIQPYQLPSKEIIEIKRYLILRERLVKQRAGFQSALKESKGFLKSKDLKLFFDVHKKMIKELSEQIEKVDGKLNQIIINDEQLKKMYDLITSIKGVGPQTALFCIALTNGFTLFKAWRKFASYSGIAPFPNRSGTSLKGRTKVSYLANKKMKTLLSSCAVNSINTNPEMKNFFQRRITEGKSKMSTINIIRNKIVARIFAVVERGTPYVDTMKYAA